MSRMRDALRRGEPFRDSQLFVVACEGIRTEHDYFENIKLSLRQSRLRIRVVQRDNPGASSPASVVQTLLDYKNNEGEPDDLYWAVFDRDEQSWSEKQIHDAIKQCQEEGLGWAISNPFFEVWLAMHYVADSSRLEEIGATNPGLKQYVGERKNDFGGSLADYYDDLVQRMERAMSMSQKCGCCNEDLVPRRLCSQMYRIAQELALQRYVESH